MKERLRHHHIEPGLSLRAGSSKSNKRHLYGTSSCPTGMDLTGGVGVPPYLPPVVTRRHNMRHKKTRSQIEPRRVPGGRQHTPSLEAFNANHCIFQETVFCLFLLVHQGSYSLSLSLSVPSTQYPQLHPQHPQAEQLLRRDGCTAPFFSACRG